MNMLQHPIPLHDGVNRILPTDVSEVARGHDERPTVVYSRSDPLPQGQLRKKDSPQPDEASSRESRDFLEDFPLPLQAVNLRITAPTWNRRSTSTYRSSPNTSRPDSPLTAFSRPSLPSTVTSASVLGGDHAAEPKAAEGQRRPSFVSRIRSKSFSGAYVRPRRLSIHPLDFQFPSEEPERHFIDSIGMVIPGACNRRRCSHPLSHFVTNWRLCEPIEYTTALADHGLTYTDYDRLTVALANFLETLPKIQSRSSSKKSVRQKWWEKLPSKEESLEENDVSDNHAATSSRSNVRDLLETSSQFRQTEQHASQLNGLLRDITFNLRARGLPIMICVGSFSLFAPNRISEALLQILHVPFESREPSLSLERGPDQRISFVDPTSLLIKTQDLENNLLVSRRRLSHQSGNSSDSPTAGHGAVFHHHQLHLRDKSRPWPLWPNAIPTRKRALMDGNADRYGMDPYFRAWMRANINSRTTSTSYAKYMIEREDNPFVSTRLEYVISPPTRALLWQFFMKGCPLRASRRFFSKKYQEYDRRRAEYYGTTNRSRYEHNVRLECRKTVEHGSRLRLVRFSFRNPLYPPHNPEMGALGLTEEKYHRILSHIQDIAKNAEEGATSCAPRLRKMMRHRSAEEALTKVSEYIRSVNAQQRNVVWTIEKVPGAYETFFGTHLKEWEISVWNGEDPLELLLQLERWGIIEKRLDIDEEE